MSLIKVRKIATLDSEAKDIQLPFIITFNNGKKEFREGYSEEEVRRRFDKSVAALYGGIKSVKLEGEDKRDGKDSIAADAQFKVGDRVKVDAKYSSNVNGGVGIVSDIKNGDVVVEFTGHGKVRVPALYVQSADSSFAADANFKVGDRVKHAKVKFPVQPIGKISEVYDDPRWVEVEWENMPYKYQTIETSNLLPANSRAADAGDAAELRVVHAKGIGKWWVEPNLSRFNDADREQTHKGRKEFPDREAAIKYARGTGKTFIVNDACEDSAEFHVGQRVRAKDPRWTGYQGHALGNGVYTVKKVDRDGTVKLDGFLDVWISPSSLVEANDACGKDGDSEYELGMRVLKAVGKVEDEIVAGVRRAKQLVNNVPDEDVKRRLNRKLDDIAKIADSFDEVLV